jgi:hypothetical protein
MSEIKMLVGGATAVTPPLNEVKLYVKSDKRFYMQDDTGAEVKLLTDETTLASLSVQAPLLSTGGSNPTLSVSPVTTTANGVMSFADKVKLNSATNNNVGNTLILRDASGNFTANQITATDFIGTASNVTTIPSLSGAITSTGTNNLTSLATGVVVNNNISNSAAIQLSKLELNPTLRSNHTGTQDANTTLTNLDVAVENYLTSTAPITNDMIDSSAAISLSKLATNPLNRANHTGSQLANTISDFDVQVDISIGDYLLSNPIDNADISPSAAIALSKLAVNPIARTNHTGTQLANTISNFNAAVASAITAGNGVTIDINGEIDVVGTTDRITVAPGSIDIASNYLGQPSITTVGTITSGNWNGTIIPITYGGTGAASAGAAANRLLAVTSVSTSVTLNNTDGVVLVDASGGVRTVTLPSASTNYKYVIKKVDSSSNNVIINPAGGNTIEGASSKTLTTQYQFETLISNGTTWYLI